MIIKHKRRSFINQEIINDKQIDILKENIDVNNVGTNIIIDDNIDAFADDHIDISFDKKKME